MTDKASAITKPNDIPNVNVVTWENITENDTGAARIIPWKSDKTITFSGTPGGATLTLQGSNNGTDWFTCKDVFGNDVEVANTTGMFLVAESPLLMKVARSGGSSTDMDVVMTCIG